MTVNKVTTLITGRLQPHGSPGTVHQQRDPKGMSYAHMVVASALDYTKGRIIPASFFSPY